MRASAMLTTRGKRCESWIGSKERWTPGACGGRWILRVGGGWQGKGVESEPPRMRYVWPTGLIFTLLSTASVGCGRFATHFFFLESTFKDQINPTRQTAGPCEGGSPELDLASFGLSPKAEPDAETAPLLARWVVLPSTYHLAL